MRGMFLVTVLQLTGSSPPEFTRRNIHKRYLTAMRDWRMNHKASLQYRDNENLPGESA
jgi:hypothetical protein